jgi:hypothetical protein
MRHSSTANAQTRPATIALHLPAALAIAAVAAAQRTRLRPREWLEQVVADACQQQECAQPQPRVPWSSELVELFAQVAATSPELLSGRWRVLLGLVESEADLWDYPSASVGELEDGARPLPRINTARLRAAWPRLVACAFV